MFLLPYTRLLTLYPWFRVSFCRSFLVLASMINSADVWKFKTRSIQMQRSNGFEYSCTPVHLPYMGFSKASLYWFALVIYLVFLGVFSFVKGILILYSCKSFLFCWYVKLNQEFSLPLPQSLATWARPLQPLRL